jgi:hypothetical protein
MKTINDTSNSIFNGLNGLEWWNRKPQPQTLHEICSKYGLNTTKIHVCFKTSKVTASCRIGGRYFSVSQQSFSIALLYLCSDVQENREPIDFETWIIRQFGGRPKHRSDLSRTVKVVETLPEIFTVYGIPKSATKIHVCFKTSEVTASCRIRGRNYGMSGQTFSETIYHLASKIRQSIMYTQDNFTDEAKHSTPESASNGTKSVEDLNADLFWFKCDFIEKAANCNLVVTNYKVDVDKMKKANILFDKVCDYVFEDYLENHDYHRISLRMKAVLNFLKNVDLDNPHAFIVFCKYATKEM